jgi:putative (di)nucleoside polyphosphate hydrolase
MAEQYFRASAGAVIADGRGRVLVCRRADVAGEAWQLPQGGVQQGEDPLTAAYREIEEETGIGRAQLELLAVAPEWLAYELPPEMRNAKTGLGQSQKWHLFRFRGRPEDIVPDSVEFAGCRWSTFQDLLARAIAFRRPVYQQVFALFAAYLGEP